METKPKISSRTKIKVQSDFEFGLVQSILRQNNQVVKVSSPHRRFFSVENLSQNVRAVIANLGAKLIDEKRFDIDGVPISD